MCKQLLTPTNINEENLKQQQEIGIKELNKFSERWRGKPFYSYNPKSLDKASLPYVICFEASKKDNRTNYYLISQDGVLFQRELIFDKNNIYQIFGLLEGSETLFHSRIKEVYPDGFKIFLLRYDDAKSNRLLNVALFKFHQSS